MQYKKPAQFSKNIVEHFILRATEFGPNSGFYPQPRAS